jgi:hypothetical protein
VRRGRSLIRIVEVVRWGGSTADERSSVALENDSTNPCFGCGPSNPRGLRLSFRRIGDRVETALLADVTMEGWPGRLHSGILYTAMLETANWTVYGVTGRIGVPVRTSALSLQRWVPTGTRLRIAGRSKSTSSKSLTVAVEAFTLDGPPVAALDRDFVLPNRREFLEKMGYSEIPEVFAGLIPE